MATSIRSCNQGEVGASIAAQLAAIAARLDAILTPLKADVEELKARMYVPLKNDVEAIKNRMILPIKPEARITGNGDRLHKEDHSGSNMNVEEGSGSLTGDKVIRGGDNREKVEKDSKITVAESNLMTTKRGDLVNFDIKKELHLEFEIKSNRLDALKTQSIRKSIMFGEKLKDSGGGPGTSRIGQVFESQLYFNIFYNLSKTLRFHELYLLGREMALCSKHLGKKVAGYELFFDILKDRGEKLLRYPYQLPKNFPHQRLLPNRHQINDRSESLSRADDYEEPKKPNHEHQDLLTTPFSYTRLEDKSFLRAGSIDTNPIPIRMGIRVKVINGSKKLLKRKTDG